MWTDFNRPNNVLIRDGLAYVTEIGFHANRHGGEHFIYMADPPPGHTKEAQVSICTLDGTVLARLGAENIARPGNIIAPHGITMDSKGDLYVGETSTDGGACQAARRRHPADDSEILAGCRNDPTFFFFFFFFFPFSFFPLPPFF